MTPLKPLHAATGQTSGENTTTSLFVVIQSYCTTYPLDLETCRVKKTRVTSVIYAVVFFKKNWN